MKGMGVLWTPQPTCPGSHSLLTPPWVLCQRVLTLVAWPPEVTVVGEGLTSPRKFVQGHGEKILGFGDLE